jgi:uridine phosphorylase
MSAPLKCLNPVVRDKEDDYFYHLGFGAAEAKKMFGDIGWVIMQGSPHRAAAFATKLAGILGVPREGPIGKTERFSMYRVGRVISISHGMGMPSMSICLHECAKCMAAAGAVDPVFIRIGTSGGIGCPPGSVVICTDGLDSATLKPEYRVAVAGKMISRSATMDPSLVKAVVKAAKGVDINTILGKTVGCDSFYEGQGRRDSFFDEVSDADRSAYLDRCIKAGAANIEMESVAFGAFTRKAGIRGTVVCCTLLDRRINDQVLATAAELAQYADNAWQVVIRYLLKSMRMEVPRRARL